MSIILEPPPLQIAKLVPVVAFLNIEEGLLLQAASSVTATVAASA